MSEIRKVNLNGVEFNIQENIEVYTYSYTADSVPAGTQKQFVPTNALPQAERVKITGVKEVLSSGAGCVIQSFNGENGVVIIYNADSSAHTVTPTMQVYKEL